MANGRPGHHGAAAVSRVVVEASDGSVSALGLSLGEQPARAPRMSTDSVALSDVLVRLFPCILAQVDWGQLSITAPQPCPPHRPTPCRAP